ncbi:hypothetical protein ERO13_D04G118050v2 [Gossypium hirsutum]|uniref:DUF7086 domain-containing protein n=1 Tax=Gossypium hirsutum TaxID=3635 RepID=A0A1U8ITE9_GOSHI|nr:uncharacterized protein LOC107898170 [Gossypium hirsutum]KAG4152366.1 hypothetical protein ERO13_D04G118050v2 [Gossypium hirsutum]
MDPKRLQLNLWTPSISSSSSSLEQNPYFSYCHLLSIDHKHHLPSSPSNLNATKGHHQEFLHLDLTLGPPPDPSSNPNPNPAVAAPTGRRARANPFQKLKGGKSETITAPYPWATTRRARVHDLNYLQSNNIRTINGQVECKVCQTVYTIEYDIEEKLKGIKDFVLGNRWRMNDRAPKCWMYPRLDNCKNCGSSLKPVIGKKRDINWLFLVLGQMLGCCKLSDLKYFCKHTKNHRTGAKNRLLYIAYIELCKQLCPHGPFHL